MSTTRKKLQSFQKNFAVSKNDNGFTLVEIIISSAIIGIIGLSILGSIILFTKYSQQAKETVQAQNLANEQIEILHNLPYDSLATVSGPIYPPGTINDIQTIVIDSQTFKVHTFISYVDDPFDGLSPTDYYPYDYKKITITVKDKYDSKTLAETTTNISGKAAETASNTGILSLKVQNAQGLPVPNALVVITNPNQAPPVNITTFTDVTGSVFIPKLPPSTLNDYHVVVSLNGYNSDATYPAFAPDNLNPVQPDFNILDQQITPLTLIIDHLGNMTVTAHDTSGAPISGLQLNFKSDKLTYSSPDTHKYDQNFNTDSNGLITINNIEWDSYLISVPSGYYIVSSSPYQKVNLSAGQTVNVNLVVSTNSSYPTISTVTPSVGVNNSTLDFVITGTNLVSGTTVTLKLSGQADINASGVTSAAGDTQLNGTFDLTGVQTGNWDLVVTDPSSNIINQAGGFVISDP